MEKYCNSSSDVKQFEIINCQLKEVKEEKENIKQELFSLLSKEKEILENQNVFTEMIKNYNVLKDAYQRVNEELNNCKMDNNSIDIEIQKNREKYLQLENKIKNLKEENERLVEKLINFEKMISKKQYILNNIKYYNYYQHLRLLKNNEKLKEYKKVLCSNETFVEHKIEIFEYYNNYDDENLQKIYIELNQYDIIKFKIITENRMLVVECALMKHSNFEFEELLQNCKLQIQTLLIKINKSSDKLKLLISILNQIKPKEYIDKYYDKCPKFVELKCQNIEMEKNVEMYVCKINKIKDYNCKLVKIIDYLKLKIDIIKKDLNEKQKLLKKKKYIICVEHGNLESTLNLKNETVNTLSMEFSNIKRLREDKLENVYKLKKKLYDLKSNQKNQILMSTELSNSKNDNTNVNTVLNNFFLCF